MAIQAHMGGSQDWLFMSNNNQNIFNNTNNNYNNNMGFNEFSCSNNIHQQQQQLQQQLQQQEVLLQLQQQYLVHLQNQQQKNTSCGKIINNNNNINNNDGFVFLSTSKNNCTSTTTASTTTTTTGSDYYNMRPMNFSTSFADQLEKQRQEIDRFITLQNERLKLALQEQRKQQLSTIMKKLEAKAMQLLTQKDEEIARATKRTIELQDIITKMEIENQEWQRLATQNEAMVISLNNKLEQVNNNNKQAYCMALSSSCESNEGDQDEESCCNVINNNKEVFSNNNKGKEEIISGAHIKSVVLCKVCKVRKSCILLLPCRHLCCCKGCEPFIDACPVCESVRMASIEALIS